MEQPSKEWTYNLKIRLIILNTLKPIYIHSAPYNSNIFIDS